MILITGGAGFIGSNLAHALMAAGEDVAICDWLETGNKWRNLEGLELFDFIHPEDLFHWLKTNQPRIIYHMGAISSTTETNVDAFVTHNINLSSQLWTWCAEHNSRFIYASSAATYGNGHLGFTDHNGIEFLKSLRPLNPYGWSKNTFDIWAVRRAERGFMPKQWVGLKFFNVYGPREAHKDKQRSVVHQLYEQIKRGEPTKLFKSHHPDYSDGGQKRDFVYVRDCCNVMLWLKDNIKINGIFNVGTGKARSFLDLAQAVYWALDLEPNIQYIDMPENIRKHYQYFTQSDNTHILQVGYSDPYISLEGGVSDYIHWLEENNNP